MASSFISFRGISKHFGGVSALRDVSLEIGRAECHGLMGENGAGKSTLGKVLAGIHKPDAGTLAIDGHPYVFTSPRDALAAGVAMVHQELAFCPELSVAENLCMGRLPARAGGWMIDRPKMARQSQELLAAIGVSLDVRLPMKSLSTAQEQLVQIAAAVGSNPRIIVFDEPTSSLSAPEAERLFELIESLKAREITTIYVSHRMPELFRLCDRISVLRDGQYVGTLGAGEMTQDAVVRMMIGGSVTEFFPHDAGRPALGEVALRVRGLASPGRFRDINFEVRRGEIVGFAGLVGAGRSQVAKAIFGLDPRATGEVEVSGESLPLRSVQASLGAGIGLLPEDRKRQGCVLGMASRANISMAILPELNLGGILDRKKEEAVATRKFDQMRIKAASLDAPVRTLSGGNQQKVALAKWLARGGKILIVDEPTRGVDIGAKAAIHGIIDRLAMDGMAIMLISSELPEIVNLCTRILVMRDGAIVGELSRAEATQEAVLRMMAGMSPSTAVDEAVGTN